MSTTNIAQLQIIKSSCSSLIFSSGNMWEGFRVENYFYPPMCLPALIKENHMLTFNIGEPLVFSWKANGHVERFICKHGDIVELSSPSAGEETQWTQEYTALSLVFDPTHIDQLLEVQNFTFNKLWNLEDSFLKEVSLKLYEEVLKGDGV